MLRTFSEHSTRKVQSLDGLWEFHVPEKKSSQEGHGKPPKKFERKIHVPSVWESLPGLENHRGEAWFRTTIPTYKNLGTRIVFGGVSHTGTLYIDGKMLGSHYDAFTPWDVLVPASKDGYSELTLHVDNSFGEHSALHMENDYYTYGGITRPVEAQFVPSVYIDKIFATPRLSKKTWDLDLRIRLKNWGRKTLLRKVRVSIAGIDIDFGEVSIQAGESKELSRKVSKLNVKPWSAEYPYLYSVCAELYEDDILCDDLIDRVGFREIRVRKKELLLNGSAIRLKGFCRHEDHAQFGCAIPLEAMVTDLELIRDMGGNFIRSVHYPNDLRFLDLCDEMGFYVWEESHSRTVDFKHPKFKEQIDAVTAEMVEWHFNRPSILMWGSLNECDSDSASGYRHYKRVLGILRKLDDSRPITYADDRDENNLCVDLVDIVAWNLYDGWYDVDDVKFIEPNLKAKLAWLRKTKTGRNKPVIMSEFGAGAIYGNRSPKRVKWTEEYQAEVLAESLRVYQNHPDVVGVSIWQFCDVRVTREGNRWWPSRPRTMNNKGIVDEYRRPKMAYEVVKKMMSQPYKKIKP